MKKFFPTHRVIRIACPPECGGGNCPGHIPVGTRGQILPYLPERTLWFNKKTGQNDRVFTWRIDWDAHGEWWTIDHCFEIGDTYPGFPDSMWTE